MLAKLALVLALLAAGEGALVPRDGSGLTLDGQRGELDVSGKEPVLRFSVLAKNRLPVGIERVRVGVLYAEDGEVLKQVDPASAYKQQAPSGAAYRVVDQEVAAALPAGKEQELHLTVPVRQGDPAPRAFVTHVLGYRLAEVGAELLFALLDTTAAADELAAVTALGLAGEAAERQAARRKFAEREELVHGLVAEAGATIPERPSEGDTFRRVYAVVALGVLGGPVARTALEQLREQPALSRFDEPLQVLRIARLVGSRLETPLAYAIPTGAQTMRELVGAALAEASALAVAPVEPAAEPPAAPALDATAAPAPATPGREASGLLPAVLTAAITFTVLASSLLFWQRRRRAP